MAELDGDVLRLDAVAQQMDHVEMLGELGEFLIIGERARPLAAVGVGHMRRPGDGNHRQVSPADDDGTGGVTGHELDFPRRLGEGCFHQSAIEADHAASSSTVGPAAAKTRCASQHAHPSSSGCAAPSGASPRPDRRKTRAAREGIDEAR
jgi:hypothetical protein